MNFLRLKSKALARFRQRYPQYWLDMLVEKVKRERKLGSNDQQLVFGQVLAVVKNEQLGMSFVMPGLNIVTNDGDIYYAQKAVSETPGDDFVAGGLRLGSAATAPTKTDTDVTTFLATSGHTIDATYPQTVDPDTDNTGDGVDIASWRISYTTAEGNVSGIQEGAIVDNTTTPTAALTHFLFASSFSKTASDTLKVFVNHEFTGV